ncbi:MAG: hypothetical protein ACLQIB_42550 [Isosphaeraceae bacterium]
MRDRLAPRISLVCLFAGCGFSLAGCGAGPETDYGSSEGKSLNGISVLSAILQRDGHEVEAAIRLNDDLAEWAGGIIRFAPYPGPPDREEANWYARWLAADPARWLIYVAGDFDASPEYWSSVVQELAQTVGHQPEEKARESLGEAASRARRLAARSAHPADAGTWFEMDSAREPPRACTILSGPWAAGVDAAAVALVLHEPLKAKGGRVLLAGDGKAFVIEKSVRGENRLLVIANGSFLLNEALVNSARSRLLAPVLDWIGPDRHRIALVEGSFILGEADEPLSLWQLLRRLASLRWIAVQIGLAALFAALARAPRLGRPRDEPGVRADRPAAHAEALGALLARSRSPERAREIIDRYRRRTERRKSDG